MYTWRGQRNLTFVPNALWLCILSIWPELKKIKFILVIVSYSTVDVRVLCISYSNTTPHPPLDSTYPLPSNIVSGRPLSGAPLFLSLVL